jgi:hypothetical protein
VTAADNACAFYSGVTFRFFSRSPPVCQAEFSSLFIYKLHPEKQHMSTQGEGKKAQE